MSAPGPVDPKSRLLSLDTLRGIALCGILLINIIAMGGPFAMDRPLSNPAITDPDWQIWGFSVLFVTNTMRGLFSMLFGIGLLLFVGKEDGTERLNLILRRLMLLFVFGVIDATFLLWPGDILMTYALAGAAALMLLRLRPAGLFAAATTILLFLSAWDAHVAAATMPAETVYSARMLATEQAARLGGYWQNFDYAVFVSWNLTANALVYRGMGDALSLMLIGMALFRLGWLDDGAREQPLRWMVAAGYGMGFGLRLVHLLMVWSHQGGPTFASALIDQPGRLAMTLGHVGLFFMVWRRGVWPNLMASFAHLGRMALTLYLGQSLIAAVIFSGFGFGLWKHLSRPQLWLMALAILAIQVTFATLWFRPFRFGPVEWLWRWGTYGTRPRFRS